MWTFGYLPLMRLEFSHIKLMPPPPAPNVLEDIRGFVLSIPTITRYLTFGTLAFSLGLQFGLCRIQQIVLLADPLKKLEVLFQLIGMETGICPFNFWRPGNDIPFISFVPKLQSLGGRDI